MRVVELCGSGGDPGEVAAIRTVGLEAKAVLAFSRGDEKPSRGCTASLPRAGSRWRRWVSTAGSSTPASRRASTCSSAIPEARSEEAGQEDGSARCARDRPAPVARKPGSDGADLLPERRRVRPPQAPARAPPPDPDAPADGQPAAWSAECLPDSRAGGVAVHGAEPAEARERPAAGARAAAGLRRAARRARAPAGPDPGAQRPGSGLGPDRPERGGARGDAAEHRSAVGG